MSLLNAKQSCEYLGIGKLDNFRELVAKGEIGYKVVGRTKFYPVEELDRWLRELTYSSSTKGAIHTTHHSIYHRKTNQLLEVDTAVLQMIKKKQNSTAKRKFTN